jgi:hypothetical protein
MRTYYHITDVANRDSIQRDGIRPNEEGYIYLLSDLRWQHNIARDIFAMNCDIWTVQLDPRKLELDRVGELYSSAGAAWRIHRPTPLKHVKRRGSFELDTGEIIGSILTGGRWKVGPMKEMDHEAFEAMMAEQQRLTDEMKQTMAHNQG